MNSFGQLFRVNIFGESHGESVGILIDGCPAGLSLGPEDLLADIERRKGGQQPGTTPRIEEDLPNFKSGLFQGKTTGAPLLICFDNKNTRSSDYEKQRSIPRPGHADFVAAKKFGGFEDYRGSGHFSGRLTLPLVAAGAIAKKLLGSVQIAATLTEVGGYADIEKGIAYAIAQKDSVGGIVECRVSGLAVGLGEPFFDATESLLAHAVFAVPAIRGIEFGTGFAAARLLGSQHNDAIEDAKGTTRTNHAGGIVGGLTNGNELVFRVAVKPTSSTPQEQRSLNTSSGQQEEFIIKGRHDLCIALRVPVVIEAVTALVLADLLLREQHIKRVLF
ncbi:MAG: chorismate synthase [Sphingomonadales bacterium]|nr:chorismate synthase [Sphingomonadales bacterium]